MIEYLATFGIKCGVSTGYGLKLPDYIEREEKFNSENEESALTKALEQAINFGNDYLSNPEDNFTTVTLLSLRGTRGKELNQREILRRQGFNGVRRFGWEGDNLVRKTHLAEHLLL